MKTDDENSTILTSSIKDIDVENLEEFHEDEIYYADVEST